MKIELGKVVSSKEALIKIAQLPMKAKMSFRVAKAIKQIELIYDTYAETRNNRMKKYQENGEIKPGDKNWDNFIAEMEEVLGEEIDIDITKIPISSIADISLTPSELVNLDWLIKEK